MLAGPGSAQRGGGHTNEMKTKHSGVGVLRRGLVERRGASEKDTEGLHCAQGLGRGAGLQAQGWAAGHSPGRAVWPQSSLLSPVPGPHFPWSQSLLGMHPISDYEPASLCPSQSRP